MANNVVSMAEFKEKKEREAEETFTFMYDSDKEWDYLRSLLEGMIENPTVRIDTDKDK